MCNVLKCSILQCNSPIPVTHTHAAHLVCDNGDARVLQIEPVGQLSICHDVYVAHPGRKPLQGAQRVP